jgi:hypothetical protein
MLQNIGTPQDDFKACVNVYVTFTVRLYFGAFCYKTKAHLEAIFK